MSGNAEPVPGWDLKNGWRRDAREDEKDAHTEHCCSRHGCKYGSADCPVARGIKAQSFPCGDCHEEGEELVAALRFGAIEVMPEPMGPKFQARLRHEPKSWETGRTEAEAVGALVLRVMRDVRS